MPKQETLDIIAQYSTPAEAQKPTAKQPHPETMKILNKYSPQAAEQSITSREPESEGFISSAIESAKRGISSGLGDIAFVFDLIGGAMTAPKGQTAFSSLIGRLSSPETPQGQSDAARTALDTRKTVKSAAMQAMGGSSGAPRADSTLGKASEALVEGAVNPVNLLMPIKKLYGTGEIAKRSLFGAGAGAGSVVGKEAGAPVGAALGRLAQTPLGEPMLGLGKYFGIGSPSGVIGNIDFEEGGRKTGAAAGALVGGAVGAIAASRIPQAIGARRTIRNLREGGGEIGKELGEKINVTAEGIAEERVLDLFKRAYDSNPNFAKAVDELHAAESKTGISVPVGNMMNSPLINDAIREVARTDPTFKQQYLRQFEEAKQALADQSMLFGEPSGAAGAIRSAGLKDRDVKGLSKEAATRIEQKASGLVEQYSRIGKQELGIKTDVAVEQAEKAARAQAKPFYNDAFKYADEKGLVMPESTVQKIYDSVLGAQASDIFRNFPSIIKKVQKEFNPSVADSKPLVILPKDLKNLEKNSGGDFATRSIEVLDSLKREVNRSLRLAKEQTDVAVLRDLKQTIQKEIESIDPEFASRYRLADKVYADKFGIPFDAESLRQISRARFVDNIVPILTKNKSAIEQVQTVLGKDGTKLVSDAFKHDLYEHVIVNKGSPNTWLARNRDALSAIPGEAAKFKQLANDHNALMAYKSFAEVEWLDKAKSALIRVEGREANDIVADIYKSNAYAEGLVKQYGHKKDAMNAIKSIMLDDILSSGNIAAALNDRFKVDAYRKIFGGDVFDNRIKPIATLTDSLSKNDPTGLHTSFGEIMNPSVVSSKTGTSMKTMMSLLVTNPVISAEVATTQLLGNFFRNKVGKATHNELARILLDKNEALKLKNMLDERARKGLVDKNGNLIPLSKDATAFAKMIGGKMMEITARDAQSGAVRGSATQHDHESIDKQNDVELFYGE